MFKYSFWIKTNVARVTLEAKNTVSRLDLCKTGYKPLVLSRSEFLKLTGAPNEPLSLIIIF